MTRPLKEVLLVDDSDADNYLHTRVLKQTGLVEHVRVARDGHEAMVYLQAAHPLPDLVFLDINMPRMNGWELLDALSEFPEERRDFPVIVMLTTSIRPEDRARADASPLVADFVDKPLTVELVRQVVALAER